MDRTGETPAVVVSHRYWRGRLGGGPDALGRTLRINDLDVRIVGVAPPGFFGLSVGGWSDLYAPLAARAVLEKAGGQQTENPASWWVEQVAVLTTGRKSDGRWKIVSDTSFNYSESSR